jgi:hypothetical protein
MVLDFIPCDVDNFSFMFKDYNKLKNNDGYNQNKLLFELLDTRFCKYILPRGKNKGKLCMKKFRCGGVYCSEHTYLNTKCIITNCENKRRKGHKICTKHLKFKTSIEDENDENLYYVPKDPKEDYEYYNIDNFLCYYPNMNIYNIKFGNEFPFPKNIFDNKNIDNCNKKSIIKYKRFSIIRFLYNIYIKYKKMISYILQKYNINIPFLYYLLLYIKQVNEINYNTINIKDYIQYMINVPLDDIVVYNIANKNNNELTIKNEKKYIKKEAMNNHNELTSYGVCIDEFEDFVDEHKNNSVKCNISNEIKKTNILKKDMISLFKDYNLDMGLLKKQIIIFIKNIQKINDNKDLSYIVKYVEIRNEQKIFYEDILENKIIIINDIKKHNRSKMNNINFNNFYNKILSLSIFFDKDYIYFENNYYIN